MWSLMLSLFGCGPTPAAEGQASSPEAPMRAHFGTYRTFVARANIGEWEYLLRGDHRGRLILEGGEWNNRILWDGEHLTMDVNRPRTPEKPAVAFGPLADALVAGFVAELRTGFASTTFTDAAPSSIGYTQMGATEAGFIWRRLDLPGTGDDGIRIFIAVNRVTDEWNGIYFLDPAGKELKLPYGIRPSIFGVWDFEWDVPLLNDLDRVEAWPLDIVRADPTKWGNLNYSPERLRDGHPSDVRTVPYHERYNRYALPFSTALSTGSTPPLPALPVESAYAAWEGTCTPNAVRTVPFQWVWRPDTTALDWAGVTAAVSGTCPIHVEMHPRARVKLAPGSKGRFQGTFQVKKLAPGAATLSNQPFDSTRTGPLQDQTDLSWTAPIGSAPPGQLEVVVQGTLTLTCGPTATTVVQGVGFAGLDDRTLPRLRWEGCMPQPPPRE